MLTGLGTFGLMSGCSASCYGVSWTLQFLLSINTIFAEIFSNGELPWREYDNAQLASVIQRRSKLAQPENCPNEFYYDIMLSCWRLDPFSRISSPDIITCIASYTQESSLLDKLAMATWPASGEANVYELTGVDVGVDLDSAAITEMLQGLETPQASVALGKQLGEGAFGVVHEGYLDSIMKSVAVKSQHENSSIESSQKFILEAKMFATLRHPNIVTLIGVCLTVEPYAIIMELMIGDLRSVLKEQKSTIEPHVLIGVLKQIAGAMAFLSNHGIIHRDLAARCAYVMVISVVIN